MALQVKLIQADGHMVTLAVDEPSQRVTLSTSDGVRVYEYEGNDADGTRLYRYIETEPHPEQMNG